MWNGGDDGVLDELERERCEEHDKGVAVLKEHADAVLKGRPLVSYVESAMVMAEIVRRLYP